MEVLRLRSGSCDAAGRGRTVVSVGYHLQDACSAAQERAVLSFLDNHAIVLAGFRRRSPGHSNWVRYKVITTSSNSVIILITFSPAPRRSDVIGQSQIKLLNLRGSTLRKIAHPGAVPGIRRAWQRGRTAIEPQTTPKSSPEQTGTVLAIISIGSTGTLPIRASAVTCMNSQSPLDMANIGPPPTVFKWAATRG